jgi:hypothetical protein
MDDLTEVFELVPMFGKSGRSGLIGIIRRAHFQGRFDGHPTPDPRQR